MRNIMRWAQILITLVAVSLLGCGESEKFYGPGGGTVTPGVNYTLSAAAIQSSIVVGTTTNIRALLVDENQQPVSGQTVTFYIDNGTFGGLQSTTAATDGNGIATATVTAAFQVGSGTVDVSYGDSSTSVGLTYTVGPIRFLTLDALPAAVGVSSDSSITVTALDQYGNPVTNRAMQFASQPNASGGSFVGPGIASTNSSGTATVVYTSGALAPVQDTITVTELVNPGVVSATKIIDVTQSAVAVGTLSLGLSTAATSITVGSTGITANATVVDTKGNALPGVDVAFQITGTGDFAGAKAAIATTNASGLATAALTVPNLVGGATITAVTAGKTASIKVTYIPSSPALMTISASPTTVGVSTDSTITATFFDSFGNLTPNEPVTFAVIADNSGGSVLSNPTGLTQTNASGIAEMVYTSGSTNVGVLDRVQARATNGTQPTGSVDISVSQSATQISTLKLALSTPSTSITVGTNTVTADATVLDSSGTAVPGVNVTFQIIGGGDFGGSKTITVPTNPQGVAQTTLAAPSLVGTAQIIAASAGLTSAVTVTYIPDAPSAITLNASPASLGVLSNSTLVASVYDQYGNITPSEPVTFAISAPNSGAPVLSNPLGVAQTNQSGVASMIYTSGATSGVVDTVSVTATNGTNPTVAANISVSAASTAVTGLNLGLDSATNTITVNDSTVNAIATVTNSSGGPVPGVAVAFAIQGAGTFIGNVKTLEVLTDATGVASAQIFAPVLVGVANVSASASGLSSNVLVTYAAAVPNTVILSSNTAIVDVSTDAILSAAVYDAHGNAVPNEAVVFSVSPNNSGATLSNIVGNAQTNALGVASLVYTSGTLAPTQDTLGVTVTNGGIVATPVSIDVVAGTATIPTSMTIGTNTTTINSDGSNSATITATVLDNANVVVPGATVSFTSSGGVLSAGTVVTNQLGEAVVTLNAGTDPANQVITVTGTVSGVPAAAVPVEVVGTTLGINSTISSLIIGGTDTATMTVNASNADAVGIFGANVTLAIDGTASTGAANLSAASGITGTQGTFNVDITGTSPGIVRVVATGLGATTTFDYLVESLAGSLLITSPVSGTTVTVNTPMTVSIDVPVGTTSVTLVSSLGTWAGSGSSVRTWAGLVPPVTISDDLTSTSIGMANITVADTNNTNLNASIQLVMVDKAVGPNSVVSLQATPTTVAQTVGGTQNTSSLEATVIDSINSTPIAGARVTFSISNAPGSGEYISPPVAYTDAFGVARATFYSGSMSTNPTGLVVTAELDQTLTGALKSDQVNIIVGGTAGAIAIGTSTTISSINSNTAYKQSISIQVTDASGSPVPETPVSLSLWPQEYALGWWECEVLYRDTILVNEDINKNLVLDAGEDRSSDGSLTPPISAAGAIPSSVKTDANGVATVDLVYLKDYAGFINNALSATAIVSGTETKATLNFWLSALKADVSACLLGGSPLNAHWPELSVTPELNPLPATTPTTPVYVNLVGTNGLGIAGANVTATFLSWGTDDGVTPPTIGGGNPSAVLPTDADGNVTFTYAKGGKSGDDLIKFTYTTPTGVVIARYLTMTW
ncbi:MAG: Ig-like domain-containing protein [Chromatiales bacterium]|nr:Ig-like domain-containing protein [Chromatiales bacterium]